MIFIAFNTVDEFEDFSYNAVGEGFEPCANCSRVKKIIKRQNFSIDDIGYEIATSYSARSQTAECCCDPTPEKCEACLSERVEHCKHCVWFYIDAYVISDEDFITNL